MNGLKRVFADNKLIYSFHHQRVIGDRIYIDTNRKTKVITVNLECSQIYLKRS